MKKMIIFIIIITVTKLAFSSINIRAEETFIFPQDSLEMNMLDIINNDYILLLNQIDSMIDRCLFTKKNIPNYKYVRIIDNKTIFIVVSQGYNFPISFYKIPGIELTGVYLYRNTFHVVDCSVNDSIYNKIFQKKGKIILSNELETKHTYETLFNNNDSDELIFEIKIVDNKFVINACQKCIESEEYLPLIPLGEIKYENKNMDYPVLILNSSLVNDTCTGYAYLDIEFNNLKQMKVVTINSINFICIYKCNNVIVDLKYDEQLFVGGYWPSTIETELVNELKDQIRLNIKDLKFYVPKRSKWYNKLFPSKKNDIKSISKNESVMIYFVIFKNKATP
jgi:hypothetical protein